jgi:hypothetical protein
MEPLTEGGKFKPNIRQEVSPRLLILNSLLDISVNMVAMLSAARPRYPGYLPGRRQDFSQT